MNLLSVKGRVTQEIYSQKKLYLFWEWLSLCHYGVREDTKSLDFIKKETIMGGLRRPWVHESLSGKSL